MLGIPEEEIRQAVFASTWDEYDERLGARFALAWYCDYDPSLIDRFWQDFTRRLAARLHDEPGADHRLRPITTAVVTEQIGLPPVA